MADLTQLRERITRNAAAAVSAGAREVALDAAVTAPFRSGVMASKITSRPLNLSGPVMDAVVRVNVPYAEAVILGARPHLIRAVHTRTLKDGRVVPGMLRFPTANGIVFAHEVNHPGNDPNPFLDVAMARFGEHVGEFFGRYMGAGG